MSPTFACDPFAFKLPITRDFLLCMILWWLHTT